MKNRETVEDVRMVAEKSGIPCLDINVSHSIHSLDDVIQVLECIIEPTFDDPDKLRAFLGNWGRATEYVAIVPFSEFPQSDVTFHPGLLAIAFLKLKDVGEEEADIIISSRSNLNV